MSIHRYVAERREDGISVQRVESPVVQKEEGVMGISIAGGGDPDDLAREAAELHFQRHPERKKVLIIASSRSVDWRFDET
jgi:hypothetical protein